MKKLYKDEACMICEGKEKEGMHINTSFICWECEQEIVQTEPESKKYNEFVKKLSKIKKTSVFS